MMRLQRLRCLSPIAPSNRGQAFVAIRALPSREVNPSFFSPASLAASTSLFCRHLSAVQRVQYSRWDGETHLVGDCTQVSVRWDGQTRWFSQNGTS